MMSPAGRPAKDDELRRRRIDFYATPQEIERIKRAYDNDKNESKPRWKRWIIERFLETIE